MDRTYRFQAVHAFIDGLDRSDDSQATVLRRLILRCLPDRPLPAEAADEIDLIHSYLRPLQLSVDHGQRSATITTRAFMHAAVDRLEALCRVN